jgi:hypothetical protein
MKDSHVFYAGVHGPRQLRKDVLVTQKAILDCLKKFEHIRALRQEKELRTLELKKMLNALRVISGQLKTKLPANAIKVAPKKAPEMHEFHAPKKQVVRKAPVRQKSKLELLEDELAKIESKLSSIE